MMRFLLALAILAAGCAAAQDRDFLTSDEVDQIREAQDPNLRLQLYIQFARQRVAMVEQLVAKEKPGRSGLIHDILEDYTRIIEAIDTVADDALRRKLDLTEGMKGLPEAEKQMLAVLRRIEENPPKDYARYEFVLQQAIETTADSAELSAQDLRTRAIAATEKQKKEDKELESMMRPEEVEAKRATKKKEVEKKRKVPTLRRKNERPPDP